MKKTKTKKLDGIWYGNPCISEIITSLMRLGMKEEAILSVTITGVSEFKDSWGNYKISYQAIIKN